MQPPDLAPLARSLEGRDAALVDLLDRVLDKGIVVSGEITITLAGVELLYLGLQLVVCSPDARHSILPSTAPADTLAPQAAA